MIALKNFSLKKFAGWLFLLATAFFLFTNALHHFYPSFRVQGVSMMPSIAPNSTVMAVIPFSSPERHGVYIINTNTLTPGTVKHPGDTYIKRVVGLPGDTLTFNKRSGVLLSINGQRAEQATAPEFQSFSLTSKQERTMGATFESHAHWFSLNGRTYPVYLPDQKAFASSDPKLGEYIDVFFHFPWLDSLPVENGIVSITIPDGQYFVLSDNRVAGTDSRHYGLVPLRGITHKIVP